MRAMLANLTVKRVVAHKVFPRDPDRRVVRPKCSAELTQLDPEGRIAMQDRLVSALGDNSHSVDMSIAKSERDSTFQHLASCLDEGDEEFVDRSKVVAERLADAQTSRAIPGGIVLMVCGATANPARRFVAVIKAETDDGFISTTEGDVVSFEFTPSLFMTRQQQLYKVGFFVEMKPSSGPGSGLRDPSNFRTLVYDHNMTARDTSDAAIYFYDTFLGCTASPSAAVLTSDFYYKTRDFINTRAMGDADKVDAYNALYIYLKVDQKGTVSVSEFASRYLGDKQLRDDYRTHMREQEFPMNAVSKDLSHLTRVLRRRRLRFTSDVSITAPAAGFQDLVEIIEDSKELTVTKEGHTLVRIAGCLSGTD